MIDSEKTPPPHSRGFLVGGNWKLNGSKAFIQEFCQNTLLTSQTTADVLIAPPTIYLPLLQEQLSVTGQQHVQLSAQTVSDQVAGAFTGELSVAMLEDLGIPWTLIGHSERRQYYGETNEIVASKCRTVLSQPKKAVSVILCIGERLEEREAGETWAVLGDQLEAVKKALLLLEGDSWSRIVVAYEPVWAIGTGKVATPEQAQEAHAWIRAWIRANVSEAISHSIRIIYGGSVNAANSASLALLPDIDGFLVGGASLKPADFAQICQSNSNKRDF